MKNLSFIFLKNLLTGSKMRRSFHNVCNDNNSTSTLDQNPPSITFAPSQQPSCSSYNENDHKARNAPPRKSVTLEEMILQLELEEELARKEKMQQEMNFPIPRRMSCVNNSDILRSARNALNQYPRFSLDGRDAMYRSCFRKNVGSSAIDGLKLGRILHLPQSVGGESVIWCKPGVVPKLMGLEAMPLPISRLYSTKSTNRDVNKHKFCNLKRREKKEAERRQTMKHVRDSNVCCGDMKRFGRDGGGGGGGSHSSSSIGYCVMNPIAIDNVCGHRGQSSCNYPEVS
ncbi:uncharacterized protein LOC130813973 [Amaranthus tricolor]|uniref:uncharacterized protein LOC130813973 n=1 Tax=Amaranthus tricolor TaxID=29722 RepID=UPI00258B8559|nr:uncharacterized protein LOC130813973 [Amaranthus tricolor]